MTIVDHHDSSEAPWTRPPVLFGRSRAVRLPRETGSWRLDGKHLGSAAPTDWSLWPGEYRLELVDATGRVVDTARFEVRGTGVRSTRSPTR